MSPNSSPRRIGGQIKGSCQIVQGSATRILERALQRATLPGAVPIFVDDADILHAGVAKKQDGQNLLACLANRLIGGAGPAIEVDDT